MKTLEKPFYFVGLDLGQAQDYSALAVLETPRYRLEGPNDKARPPHSLRHLKRWPLGTSYPTVLADVLETLKTPPLAGAAFLVVDQTGVGRAVVDFLTQRLQGNVNALLKPITITAGLAVTAGNDGSAHVAKKELVATLQLLLQTRRLIVARSLPLAAVLVRELEMFRVKVTAAANETFEAWRERDHDDLVLAVALAAWVGEHGLPALESNPNPPRVVLAW